MLVNPLSFSTACYLDAAGRSESPAQARVEVPAMGFAWAGPETRPREPGPATPKKSFWSRRPQAQPPLAERTEEGMYMLRNEFFEATIDPATGAIRAVHDYRTRGNRLAQQIALRMPGPTVQLARYGGTKKTEEQDYSVMAADEVRVDAPGPTLGRITSRGRLVDREGKRLAGFVETMTARRGSRVLEIEIELAPERVPEASPWNSYYAARFAWHDSTAELHRSVGMMSVATEAPRIEAPAFRRRPLGAGPHDDPHRRPALSPAFRPAEDGHAVGRPRRDGAAVSPGRGHRPALSGAGGDRVSRAADGSGRNGGAARGGERLAVPRRRPKRRGDPLGTDRRRRSGGRGLCARLLETEGRKTTLGLRSFREVTAAEETDFTGQEQPNRCPSKATASPSSWPPTSGSRSACAGRDWGRHSVSATARLRGGTIASRRRPTL